MKFVLLLAAVTAFLGMGSLLEAREASGAGQRAEINRMADRDRKKARRSVDKPAFSRRGTSQRLWKRGYSG